MQPLMGIDSVSPHDCGDSISVKGILSCSVKDYQFESFSSLKFASLLEENDRLSGALEKELADFTRSILCVIAPHPLPIIMPHIGTEKSLYNVAPHDITQQFVRAAEAVADAMLVSSGFVNGEGQMLVRLRHDVLCGSEVHLIAKGGALMIIVNAASPDVQAVVEANRIQFEQHIAQRVQSWHVSVAVKRGGTRDDERA